MLRSKQLLLSSDFIKQKSKGLKKTKQNKTKKQKNIKQKKNNWIPDTCIGLQYMTLPSAQTNCATEEHIII